MFRLYYLLTVCVCLLTLQDVPPSSVKLLVVENLLLRPATYVYVTPFTIIHYSLERRKHGDCEGIVVCVTLLYLVLP